MYDKKVMAAVKTIHSAGNGGRSDMKDLNGQELSRWIKLELEKKLLEGPLPPGTKPADLAKVKILAGWLNTLHDYLLHAKPWTPEQIQQYRESVQDMLSQWVKMTGEPPFPKVHMLRHTAEFAERWKVLGLLSEAQMESYHAKFNALYNKTHHNQSKNPKERLRRCLADTVLQIVSKRVEAEPLPPVHLLNQG
jgi:hypothetical protein